jgi:hypothetical protein
MEYRDQYFFNINSQNILMTDNGHVILKITSPTEIFKEMWQLKEDLIDISDDLTLAILDQQPITKELLE